MLDARSNSYIILNQRKPFKVVVCAITLVAFFVNTFAYDLAWAGGAPSELTSVGSDRATGSGLIRELDPATFKLPDSLGTIKYSWSSGNPSQKTIIHIQDAHCNYYAQTKIAEIVEYLNKEYGIDIVNLEGGAMGYDLSPFMDIKDKALRAKASDHFVMEGLVNGAELFAVNNPEKVVLWGIEDPKLYWENLRIYRDSVKNKGDIDKYIKSLGVALSGLKTKVFSKDLFEFDMKYNSYKAGNLEFKDYLSYLVNKAKERSVDIKKFTDIYLLSQALDEESKIDFERANNERDLLIDALQKKLSKRMLEELVVKSVEFKADKISQKDYYSYLAAKAAVVKIGLKDYPELQKYIVYIAMYDAINKVNVMEELASLEDMIKAGLCRTDDEKKLSELSKNLALLKNIFGISITRQDYEYYKKNESSFSVRNYVSFITDKAPPYGINATLDENIRDLDKYREDMVRFYEYSLKRDKAFLKNLQINKSAIVITGGFHTDNLAELFKKNNIAYVSIMPNFKSPCDGYECPYYKLLSAEKSLDLKAQLPSFLNATLATPDPMNPGINGGQGIPFTPTGELEEVSAIGTEPVTTPPAPVISPALSRKPAAVLVTQIAPEIENIAELAHAIRADGDGQTALDIDFSTLSDSDKEAGRQSAEYAVSLVRAAMAKGITLEEMIEALNDAVIAINRGQKIDKDFGDRSKAHLFVLESGIAQHNLWLERKNGAKQPIDPKLAGPFEGLDPLQQKKDLNFMLAAVRVMDFNAKYEGYRKLYPNMNFQLTSRSLFGYRHGAGDNKQNEIFNDLIRAAVAANVDVLICDMNTNGLTIGWNISNGDNIDGDIDLYEGMLVKRDGEGAGSAIVFKVDHHYPSPNFDRWSTTPLVVKWLAGLQLKAKSEDPKIRGKARAILKRLERSFTIANHQDVDMLLSNYLLRNATNEELLKRWGATFAAAALLQDHAVEPGDQSLLAEAEDLVSTISGITEESEALPGISFEYILNDLLPAITGYSKDAATIRKVNAYREKAKAEVAEREAYLRRLIDNKLKAGESGRFSTEGGVIFIDSDRRLFTNECLHTIRKHYPKLLEGNVVLAGAWQRGGDMHFGLRRISEDSGIGMKDIAEFLNRKFSTKQPIFDGRGGAAGGEVSMLGEDQTGVIGLFIAGTKEFIAAQPSKQPPALTPPSAVPGSLFGRGGFEALQIAPVIEEGIRALFYSAFANFGYGWVGLAIFMPVFMYLHWLKYHKEFEKQFSAEYGRSPPVWKTVIYTTFFAFLTSMVSFMTASAGLKGMDFYAINASLHSLINIAPTMLPEAGFAPASLIRKDKSNKELFDRAFRRGAELLPKLLEDRMVEFSKVLARADSRELNGKPKVVRLIEYEVRGDRAYMAEMSTADGMAKVNMVIIVDGKTDKIKHVYCGVPNNVSLAVQLYRMARGDNKEINLDGEDFIELKDGLGIEQQEVVSWLRKETERVLRDGKELDSLSESAKRGGDPIAKPEWKVLMAPKGFTILWAIKRLMKDGNASTRDLVRHLLDLKSADGFALADGVLRVKANNVEGGFYSRRHGIISLLVGRTMVQGNVFMHELAHHIYESMDPAKKKEVAEYLGKKKRAMLALLRHPLYRSLSLLSGEGMLQDLTSELFAYMIESLVTNRRSFVGVTMQDVMFLRERGLIPEGFESDIAASLVSVEEDMTDDEFIAEFNKIQNMALLEAYKKAQEEIRRNEEEEKARGWLNRIVKNAPRAEGSEKFYRKADMILNILAKRYESTVAGLQKIGTREAIIPEGEIGKFTSGQDIVKFRDANIPEIVVDNYNINPWSIIKIVRIFRNTSWMRGWKGEGLLKKIGPGSWIVTDSGTYERYWASPVETIVSLGFGFLISAVLSYFGFDQFYQISAGALSVSAFFIGAHAFNAEARRNMFKPIVIGLGIGTAIVYALLASGNPVIVGLGAVATVILVGVHYYINNAAIDRLNKRARLLCDRMKQKIAEKDVQDVLAGKGNRLSTFRGVAEAAFKAAGHTGERFDTVIYPASGSDITAAAMYADNVVTIDGAYDILDVDGSLLENNFDIPGILEDLIKNGMHPGTPQYQDFNSYLIQLTLLGVDLDSLKIIQRRSFKGRGVGGVLTNYHMTTVEFKLGDRTIRHTHINRPLSEKFDSKDPGDRFVADAVKDAVSGQGSVVMLAKAGAPGVLEIEKRHDTNALYELLPHGTVVVSDNPMEQGIAQRALKADGRSMRPVNRTDRAKGDLDDVHAKTGLNYGYATDPATGLRILQLVKDDPEYGFKMLNDPARRKEIVAELRARMERRRNESGHILAIEALAILEDCLRNELKFGSSVPSAYGEIGVPETFSSRTVGIDRSTGQIVDNDEVAIFGVKVATCRIDLAKYGVTRAEDLPAEAFHPNGAAKDVIESDASTDEAALNRILDAFIALQGRMVAKADAITETDMTVERIFGSPKLRHAVQANIAIGFSAIFASAGYMIFGNFWAATAAWIIGDILGGYLAIKAGEQIKIASDILPQPLKHTVLIPGKGGAAEIHINKDLDDLRKVESGRYALLFSEILEAINRAVQAKEAGDPNFEGIDRITLETHLLADNRVDKAGKPSLKALDDFIAKLRGLGIEVTGYDISFSEKVNLRYASGLADAWTKNKGGRFSIDISDKQKRQVLIEAMKPVKARERPAAIKIDGGLISFAAFNDGKNEDGYERSVISGRTVLSVNIGGGVLYHPEAGEGLSLITPPMNNCTGVYIRATDPAGRKYYGLIHVLVLGKSDRPLLDHIKYIHERLLETGFAAKDIEYMVDYVRANYKNTDEDAISRDSALSSARIQFKPRESNIAVASFPEVTADSVMLRRDTIGRSPELVLNNRIVQNWPWNVAKDGFAASDARFERAITDCSQDPMLKWRKGWFVDRLKREGGVAVFGEEGIVTLADILAKIAKGRLKLKDADLDDEDIRDSVKSFMGSRFYKYEDAGSGSTTSTGPLRTIDMFAKEDNLWLTSDDTKQEMICRIYTQWYSEHCFDDGGALPEAVDRFRREVSDKYGIKFIEGDRLDPMRVDAARIIVNIMPEDMMRSKTVQDALAGGVDLAATRLGQTRTAHYDDEGHILGMQPTWFTMREFAELFLHEFGHVVSGEHLEDFAAIFKETGADIYSIPATGEAGYMRARYIGIEADRQELFAETFMHYVLHGDFMSRGFEGAAKNNEAWRKIYEFYRDKVFNGVEYRVIDGKLKPLPVPISRPESAVSGPVAVAVPTPQPVVSSPAYVDRLIGGQDSLQNVRTDVSGLGLRAPGAAVPASTVAEPAAAVTEAGAADLSAEKMYNSARERIPQITRELFNGAPTFDTAPAPDLDMGATTGFDNTIQRMMKKDGHQVTAYHYKIGENEEETFAAIINSMENRRDPLTRLNIVEQFNAAVNAEGGLTARWIIRTLSPEMRTRVQEYIKAKLTELNTLDGKLNETAFNNAIARVSVITESIQGAKHLNPVIDLFVDIGMMEMDRYMKQDNTGEPTPEFVSNLTNLIATSMTNLPPIKDLNDLKGLVDMILRKGYIIAIRAVNWDDLTNDWKRAQQALIAA